MSVIVGVDTGLRACGVAVASARSGTLLSAWLSKSPEREDDGAQAWKAMAAQVGAELSQLQSQLEDFEVAWLVVERQAIRANFKGGHATLVTKNPSVILNLTGVAGALFGAIPARQVLSIHPSEWQGNIRNVAKRLGRDPDAYLGLILGELDAKERARIRGAELKSTGHNVVDAVGIAKWAARKYRVGLM